jgi:sec-independent protein translocase protein TatB
MPSFQDSAIIVFLALLLFGPKKLPELARQLGKLMGEFRRASNEFRMQMEDELRIADQAEQQKKLAAIEAAAPKSAPVVETTIPDNPTESFHENTIAPPVGEIGPAEISSITPEPESLSIDPLPIATSGELNLMPPATGLPEPRTAPAPVTDHEATHETEASQHG